MANTEQNVLETNNLLISAILTDIPTKMENKI